MKISSILLSVVFALALCLSMVACNEKAPAPNQSSTTETSNAGDNMPSATAEANGILPDQLLVDIEQQGAKLVLDKQFENDTKWGTLLDAIQAGIINSSSDWYSVAKKLGAHTDASKSESLRFTLARALADNPEFVLQHGDETFNIDNLCTIPYIEAEPATINGYLERMQANASKMSDEMYKQAVMACYSKLQGLLSKNQ